MKQSPQQRLATLGRARAHGVYKGDGVFGHHVLNALPSRFVNVRLVMIGQEHAPIFAPGAAGDLAEAPVLEDGMSPGPPVRIDTSIGRVFQDIRYRAVARTPPQKRPVAFAEIFFGRQRALMLEGRAPPHEVGFLLQRRHDPVGVDARAQDLDLREKYLNLLRCIAARTNEEKRAKREGMCGPKQRILSSRELGASP